MDDVFDMKAAAKRLGISPHTLRMLVRQRRVPHHRLGRRIVFTADDVLGILKAAEVPLRQRDDRAEARGS